MNTLFHCEASPSIQTTLWLTRSYDMHSVSRKAAMSLRREKPDSPSNYPTDQKFMKKRRHSNSICTIPRWYLLTLSSETFARNMAQIPNSQFRFGTFRRTTPAPPSFCQGCGVLLRLPDYWEAVNISLFSRPLLSSFSDPFHHYYYSRPCSPYTYYLLDLTLF